MGQACCKNGTLIKNQHPSPGRPLPKSPSVAPFSQRREYINKVVERAIKEELDEESNDSKEKNADTSEDQWKQAFGIISENELKNGMK